MVNINGVPNKRITELQSLGKINGKEMMLIDNGEDTFKVTVYSLLGYIAKEINAGTFPEGGLGGGASSIIMIPIGEDIPVSSRVDGNYYFRMCDITEARINAGIPMSIRVSPNMGLHIVE